MPFTWHVSLFSARKLSFINYRFWKFPFSRASSHWQHFRERFYRFRVNKKCIHKEKLPFWTKSFLCKCGHRDYKKIITKNILEYSIDLPKVAVVTWVVVLEVQVLLLVVAIVLVQVLVVLVVLTSSTPTIDSVSLGLFAMNYFKEDWWHLDIF